MSNGVDDHFEHNPQQFVGVMENGTYVFVGIKNRVDFDRIKLPCQDHGKNDDGHVLIKSCESNNVTIVFQYWVKSLTLAALQDDRLRRKALVAT